MLNTSKSLRKVTAMFCSVLLLASSPALQIAGAEGAQSVPPTAPATAPPCVPSARRYCPPVLTPTTPPTPSGSGSVIPIIAGVGTAVVLGALIFGHHGGKHSDGAKLPDAHFLEKNGPQIAETYPVGSFSVRGFTRDNWPIVIDFLPRRSTRTTLDVIIDDHKISTLIIDSNGLAGRHLEKLIMPANGWAKKPKVATYLVRSVYLDRFGNLGGPAPLEVYGIGGGPRAVGSVAIEQLNFRGGPGQPAQFAYQAKSPFNHVRTEVVRFNSDDQAIHIARVMEVSTEDVAVGRHTGSWDGLDTALGTPSHGVHRFQVRAWFTSDDKSWVGAVAPSLLTIN